MYSRPTKLLLVLFIPFEVQGILNRNLMNFYNII